MLSPGEVDPELSRLLGAPHDGDGVRLEQLWGDHKLLVAQKLGALAKDVREESPGEALEAATVSRGHAVPALGGAKVEVVDLWGLGRGWGRRKRFSKEKE